MDASKELLALKKEKNAVILAHNYQVPEIQDVADFVGDSLELSRQATQTDADIILFCGVDFMAETAKILNPEKKVIVPDKNACCPMAEMLKLDYLKRLKRENPQADVVMYVNTKAEAKAEADCVCTSANADRIVNLMESDTVIFGPDKNLAYYVQKRTKKKLIVAPPTGFCITHHLMTMADLMEAKERHPSAMVVVHPECIPEIQEVADAIASTSGILRYCKASKAKEFIIGTENGMLYRLGKENPRKRFYPLSDSAICANMKKNTLEKAYNALKSEGPKVTVPKDIAARAERAIQRMLDLSKR
jgi:quinolinate synthase